MTKKGTQKLCKYCKKPLVKKMYPSGPEEPSLLRKRMFCNAECWGKSKMTKTPTLATLRSRTQRVVERKSVCEECGGTSLLNRHHVDLDMYNNDPENIMTLCASCHTKWHWRNGKKNTNL